MRPAEDRPWTRDQREWGNGKAARQLAKERRSERGNKGGLQLAPHKHQNVTKRENGVDRLGGSQLRGARSNQPTRPAKSNPERGSHDNLGWEHPGKDREEVNSTQSREKTGRPNPHGNLKSSSRNGATGSDSNPPSGPEEQEKPTLRLRQSRSNWAHPERSDGDTSVQRRGNDHQPLTHQTTLPQGRETNGKPGPGPRAILRHLPQA